MESIVVRVLICDDHEMVRDGLIAIIESNSEFSVVASAGDMRGAIAKALVTEPVVALIDVQLETESGLDLARWFQEHQPNCKVVMLGSYVSHLAFLEAHRVGAKAFIPKSGSSLLLMSTLREVASGASCIDTSQVQASEQVLEQSGVNALAHLSQNDKDIMRCIARGFTDKEISETLFLNIQTVRNHVSKIMSKLGKTNRPQLAILMNSVEDIEGSLSGFKAKLKE
jgi:DNA-binding NarL/FixJ family response regulator